MTLSPARFANAKSRFAERWYTLASPDRRAGHGDRAFAGAIPGPQAAVGLSLLLSRLRQLELSVKDLAEAVAVAVRERRFTS